MQRCDLLVIGCGINGAGIARDAAGRGFRTVICDKGDPGGATSSASSKLIHGGVRYLEHFAFHLVGESLEERDRLLTAAPHLVRPLDFVLPLRGGPRPYWMVRAGLWLYDRLAGDSPLGRSRRVRLDAGLWAQGLAPGMRRGLVYADCRTDDARLVILTLRAAAALGAIVLPRTACIAARRRGSRWRCMIADAETGKREEIEARAVIDAAGPWAEDVARGILDIDTEGGLRLVKGSHIVVPRVHAGEHALLLQGDDRRVIFVIPFEREFSLIGTTEIVLEDMAEPIEISRGETAYLCRQASRYLVRPPTPEDVVWSFAGVRPLFDEGRGSTTALSREYRLILDAPQGTAPALVVYGGKLTTYRRLAEKAVDRLMPFFGRKGGAWTDAAPLPGGQIPDGDLDLFIESLAADLPWLPRAHVERLAFRHGSLVGAVLAGAQGPEDLGRHFGAGLYEREIAWFRAHEWAVTADDVLWRRSKAGLHMSEAEHAAVAGYMGG